LFFDVLASTLTIQGVTVYPVGTGAGSVVIALRDPANATLQSTTVNLTGTAAPGVATYVPLNFIVPQGTGYSLVMVSRSGLVASLVRDLAASVTGGGYPYTIPGTISITSGKCCPLATSTSYYYFYNWQVSTGCESARVPVTATIDPAASGTGLSRGGTVVSNMQADGTTVNYDDPCSEKVASITDAANGNVLGVTSAIVVTAPAVQTFNGAPYVPRVYDITPASNGAATLTIYALQSEFDAYNTYVTSNNLNYPLLPANSADPAVNNIVVTQYHGSVSAGTSGPLGLYDATQAELVPSTSITKTWNGQYWALTFPVSGFSGFFIHTGNGPLTVTLRSISAVNLGNRNRVDWTTVNEDNGDHFVIERSADARNFTAIGDVDAKGTAASYSFWDETPEAGMNYYRLKIMSASGKSAYSGIVKAYVQSGTNFHVDVYPNPAAASVTVQVFGDMGNNGSIDIMDVTGKLIKHIAISTNQAIVDVSEMPSGIYLVKYADDKHTEVIKLRKL